MGWKSIFVLAGICLALWVFSRRYWLIALALVIGSVTYSLHAATLQQSVIAQAGLAREDVTVEVVVTSDVKRTKHRVRGSTLNRPQSSFLARAEALHLADQSYQLRLPIRIISRGEVNVVPGDRFEIVGTLIVTREKRVAATLITSGVPVQIDEAGLLAKHLAGIRSRFRDITQRLGGDAGTLIPGMILGDTSLQSEEFAEQMRKSGLSHLTAVSGANFAIVSALVFWLSRFVIRGALPRIILTSGFLLLFLLLVRPSPSVLRAGVMAAVILLARATGNSRSAVSALAAAISLLLLLDPFQAHDPGFVLSVLATGGLIFLAPSIKAFFERFMPSWLAEIIAISTAATLLCTPYIIFLSGEVSILSVLFNVIVAPVVAPITVTGFIAVLLLPIPPLSWVLLLIAHWFSRWVVMVSEFSRSSPSWGISAGLFLLFLCTAALMIYFRGRKTFQITILLFILIINLLPRVSFPGDDWKLVQCDVGQGDALVLNLGDGSALLFDVGPSPTLIDRCLSALGVSSLPLIVISHNHADHSFGLEGALKGRKVSEIWTNGNVEVSETLDLSVRSVSQGMRAHIADVELEVLWPHANHSGFQDSSLPGDGSDENNRSVVIVATIGGVKVLVTGDIEPVAQSIIARETDLESLSILKVAHHGSRFQEPEFLEEMGAHIALISVGADNTYGHPDEGLLRYLAGRSIAVHRTDKDGPIAVSWRFDDSAGRYIFTTQTMRKEWWRVQWL